MKKITLIIAAVAMVFTACQKNEMAGTKTISLTATRAQMTTTKTAFSGNDVVWVAGDAIVAIDENGKIATLTTDKGGAKANFKGEAPEDFGTIQYAFYPANKFVGYSEGKIDFTLANASYVKEKVLAANPSFAKIGGASVQFKNVCGMMVVPVKIVEPVDPEEEIQINSMAITDGVNDLWGTCTLNCESGEIESIANGGKTITDPFVNTDDRDYYFIVPAGSFAAGVSLEVAGNYCRMGARKGKMSTTKGNTVAKSSIVVMPGLKFSFNNDQWCYVLEPAN